jgi:DNA-binding MarR family transcriptional regulator
MGVPRHGASAGFCGMSAEVLVRYLTIIRQVPVNIFMQTTRHLPRPFLGLIFRLLYQRHAQEVDAALRATGFDDIRPPHAAVFPFVPPDGIQIGELAVLAGVRKQSMAQTIQELEAAAYVVRRPDPNDKRATRVFLTAKGEAVPALARKIASRLERRWAKLIGADELEGVRVSLLSLLEKLDAGSSAGDGGK